MAWSMVRPKAAAKRSLTMRVGYGKSLETSARGCPQEAQASDVVMACDVSSVTTQPKTKPDSSRKGWQASMIRFSRPERSYMIDCTMSLVTSSALMDNEMAHFRDSKFESGPPNSSTVRPRMSSALRVTRIPSDFPRSTVCKDSSENENSNT